MKQWSTKKRPAEERFLEKFEVSPSGCWLWTAYKSPLGYGIFGAESRKLISAHRFSWILHRGPIPKGMNVNHRCDVRNCVNPEHLYIGTQGQNIQDSFDRGRKNYKGERHPQAKLTRNDVEEIRRLKSSGALEKEIAAKFGISKGHIWNIVKGGYWS